MFPETKYVSRLFLPPSLLWRLHGVRPSSSLAQILLLFCLESPALVQVYLSQSTFLSEVRGVLKHNFFHDTPFFKVLYKLNIYKRYFKTFVLNIIFTEYSPPNLISSLYLQNLSSKFVNPNIKQGPHGKNYLFPPNIY